MLGIGGLIIRSILVATCLAGLAAAGVRAQETMRGSLKITHPSVRETSGARAVARVTIANNGARADRLLRAATSIAEGVLILDKSGYEGNGLLVPGLSELVIASGAPRIEVTGLTKLLKSSDTFELPLVFQRAGEVVIKVTIEDKRAGSD